MKKVTAVSSVMILFFLATMMNVDGLGVGTYPSPSNGRQERVNDGYFEDVTSKGIFTEKKRDQKMRRNICEFARALDCDRELKDK